jgi:hypothetical protein
MSAPATKDDNLDTLLPKVPDIDAARRAVREDALASEDPRPVVDDPRAQELYTFDISLTDGSGREYAGKFTSRILGMDERVELGVLASRLALFTRWDALDPDTQWLCTVQAHLTISLDVEKGGQRPRWFKLAGADAVLNPRVLAAVYEEVASHEAFFRGPAPAARKSEG